MYIITVICCVQNVYHYNCLFCTTCASLQLFALYYICAIAIICSVLQVYLCRDQCPLIIQVAEWELLTLNKILVSFSIVCEMKFKLFPSHKLSQIFILPLMPNVLFLLVSFIHPSVLCLLIVQMVKRKIGIICFKVLLYDLAFYDQF